MNETGHKASTVRNKLQYCPKKTPVLLGKYSSPMLIGLEKDSKLLAIIHSKNKTPLKT